MRGMSWSKDVCALEFSNAGSSGPGEGAAKHDREEEEEEGGGGGNDRLLTKRQYVLPLFL